MAFGESFGGTEGTDEDEVAFDFGYEILTLDFDFLGDDGFGWGVGWRCENPKNWL